MYTAVIKQRASSKFEKRGDYSLSLGDGGIRYDLNAAYFAVVSNA